MTSTISFSTDSSSSMSEFLLWSLRVSPMIFLNTVISNTFNLRFSSSCKLQVSELCRMIDWTKVWYSNTFVNLLISSAIYILLRFLTMSDAKPILRVTSFSQVRSWEMARPRYTKSSHCTSWVLPNMIICCLSRPILPPPLTSTWPHPRCDVGLEEGEYWKKLFLCYSIVYLHNALYKFKTYLLWCTKVWAVLTGRSTVLGFDLAWFSSVFWALLCLLSLWC